MKIYIASRYGRREEMELHAADITEQGHTVTARWVYGGEDGLDLEAIANLDVEDVDRADAVLTFTEPYGSANVGGGRHWELGYGYGTNKLCIVVGPLEIVFHHLPNLKRFASLKQALRYLAGK